MSTDPLATHASAYSTPITHMGQREDCKVCPPLAQPAASTDPLAEALTNLLVHMQWHRKTADRLATGILASDWLAALIAQVRADERQKVAALLADEGTVEKVAEALGGGASTTFPRLYRGRARAALAAIAGLLDEAAGK